MSGFERLYRNMQDRIKKRGWQSPPDPGAVLTSNLKRIELVLRRLAVASALHTDEVYCDIALKAGTYQDTALRLYLLLTCVEMIGALFRDSKFHDFHVWLETEKEPVEAERTMALEQVLEAEGGLISSHERLRAAARALHADYLATHGYATNFFAFFNDSLDSELRAWISENCWVYRDKPLVLWGALHFVGPGYVATGSDELDRLTEARATWDRLNEDDRIKLIARVCQLIRNDYTHGLIATPAPQDKKSWIEDHYKSVAAAVSSGRVRTAPEESFVEMLRAGRSSATWFGVRALMNNGDFIAHDGDLEGKDMGDWLRQVHSQCSPGVDRGDTVFLWSHNLALATRGAPLTRHLEHWIDNGLKNVISKLSTLKHDD